MVRTRSRATSPLFQELWAIVMDLLTALSCRVLQVLSVRPSVAWMIESSTHCYRPRTTSMDGFTGVYRQAPRTT